MRRSHAKRFLAMRRNEIPLYFYNLLYFIVKILPPLLYALWNTVKYLKGVVPSALYISVEMAFFADALSEFVCKMALLTSTTKDDKSSSDCNDCWLIWPNAIGSKLLMVCRAGCWSVSSSICQSHLVFDKSCPKSAAKHFQILIDCIMPFLAFYIIYVEH